MESDVRFGCVNVRGWGVEKFEDVSKELCEWGMDVVEIRETHFRESNVLIRTVQNER